MVIVKNEIDGCKVDFSVCKKDGVLFNFFYYVYWFYVNIFYILRGFLFWNFDIECSYFVNIWLYYLKFLVIKRGGGYISMMFFFL